MYSFQMETDNPLEENGNSEDKLKFVIKFRDLLVCYILLLIGLSFAIIVLIIELLFKSFRINKV